MNSSSVFADIDHSIYKDDVIGDLTDISQYLHVLSQKPIMEIRAIIMAHLARPEYSISFKNETRYVKLRNRDICRVAFAFYDEWFRIDLGNRSSAEYESAKIRYQRARSALSDFEKDQSISELMNDYRQHSLWSSLRENVHNRMMNKYLEMFNIFFKHIDARSHRMAEYSRTRRRMKQHSQSISTE